MWCIIGVAVVLLLSFGVIQQAGQAGKLAVVGEDDATVFVPDEEETIIIESPVESTIKVLSRGLHSRPLSGEHYNTRSMYPIVTKALIVRSVHYNGRSDRSQRAGYTNTTVFVVEGAVRILTGGLIAQCQLGPHVTSALRVRIVDERPLTHTQALVDCYDLPIHNTKLRAFLYYREKAGEEQLYTAESEQLFEPVGYPISSCATPNSSLPCASTVVACVATLHYGAPRRSEYRLFYKWLAYLQTIGVNHVHIVTDHSFLAREGFANSYISDAITSRYISVDFWLLFLNDSNIRNHSKVLAYNHCLYKYVGVYEYAVMVDWNYFLSTGSSGASDNLLLQLCDKNKSSVCRFNTERTTAKCGSNLDAIIEGFKKGEGGNKTGNQTPVFLYRMRDMESVGMETEGKVWKSHDTPTVTEPSAIFKKLQCS